MDGIKSDEAADPERQNLFLIFLYAFIKNAVMVCLKIKVFKPKETKILKYKPKACNSTFG